jgi:putative ATPase
MNSALLSRARVLVFESLNEKNLGDILARAAEKENIKLDEFLNAEAQQLLTRHAAGDARQLLNYFETLLQLRTNEDFTLPLGPDSLEKLLGDQRMRYDKSGDQHYDVISAFIKSVRGSDPDAAIYYMARMLEGGEDPVFIARRLVILASEDIGNADPKALPLAIAGLQAVELVGMPEARINLAQVATYLASCPKSNRSYLAINRALEYVKATGALPVPKSLRSAQTKLAKELGNGVEYKYSHDYPRGFAKQDFLPEAARDQKFYEPSENGFEKSLKLYLQWLRQEPPVDGDSAKTKLDD